MTRRGLTLLELVVALALTGAAIAAGAGALGTLMDRQEAAAQRAHDDETLAAVRGALMRWIAGARVAPDHPALSFRGVDGVADAGADDALSFLTTAETPLGAGETLVELSIDRDSETPEQGLVARLSDPSSQHTIRMQLVPNAVELDLRYFTRTFASGRWFPGWISTTALPSAVELRLAAAPDDSLAAILRLPMVVPFETGR